MASAPSNLPYSDVVVHNGSFSQNVLTTIQEKFNANFSKGL